MEVAGTSSNLGLEKMWRWWTLEFPRPPSPNFSSASEYSSVHAKETDSVKDTSDTTLTSDCSNASNSDMVEFEIGSGSDERPFSDDSSSGGSDVTVEIYIRPVIDEKDVSDCWADISDASTSSDPELTTGDLWTCLRCKCVNKPLPRFCRKCFQVRKNWFPSRPKRRRKNKSKVDKIQLSDDLQHEHIYDSGISSQSSAASQSSNVSNEERINEGCDLCGVKDKNAVFIHGKTAHQTMCYKCSSKVRRTKGRCPVCERKVERVARVF